MSFPTVKPLKKYSTERMAKLFNYKLNTKG